MKLTQRNIVRIAVLFILFSLVGCKRTSTEFQKDADIIRLRHLKYYALLIEEYNDKAGHYPFQGYDDVPLYVYVANDAQIKHTKGGPPYAHKVIAFKEFVKEVERVLGSDIDEYYDPQYSPDHKPNFYMYMITNDTYFFAIHVHQPFAFAKKVAEYYYKVEISNNPNSQNRAKDTKELLKSSAFSTELNKPVSKEGFFKARVDKYLHYTKTIN
jgi:hypothetical protein